LASLKKLIVSIQTNPRDVRFVDACKVAEFLGFRAKGGKGSHHAYSMLGEPVGLNFQNRKGKIPAYQARQLLVTIKKYYHEEGI